LDVIGYQKRMVSPTNTSGMKTAEPVSVDLRELKRLRTEQRLIEVAIKLFVERGFEQTTLQQIAETAEIAPRTIFHHFSTKEELVAAWQDQVRSDLCAVVAEQPTQSGPLGVLEAAVMAVLMPRGEEHAVVTKLIERTPALRSRDELKNGDLERTLSTALWTRFGGKITEI
jgi:AcrR family transcriptional regulator